MRCSAADSAALISHMLPLVLQKLEGLAGARGGTGRNIQGLLCGTLQVIIQRLGDEAQTRQTVLQVRRGPPAFHYDVPQGGISRG